MRPSALMLLDDGGQQVRGLDQRFLGRLAVAGVDVGQQPVHQEAHAEGVDQQDADEDQGYAVSCACALGQRGRQVLGEALAAAAVRLDSSPGRGLERRAVLHVRIDGGPALSLCVPDLVEQHVAAEHDQGARPASCFSSPYSCARVPATGRRSGSAVDPRRRQTAAAATSPQASPARRRMVPRATSSLAARRANHVVVGTELEPDHAVDLVGAIR